MCSNSITNFIDNHIKRMNSTPLPEDLRYLPKSLRVIGIDSGVNTAIEQIRKFGYESVEVVMADDQLYKSPGLDDKMVIILTSEDSTYLRGIAKEFYQADVLTLIVSTHNIEVEDTNWYSLESVELSKGRNWDSLTISPIRSMPIVVKGLLDPILTPGYICYDFNDLSTTLRKTCFFKVAEVTSNKKDERIADAVSRLSEKLPCECLGQVEYLSIIIYTNQGIEPPIAMSEMKALTNYISELPEKINVLWALNHDEKMPPDAIRLSAIISGRESSYNGYNDYSL